MKRRLVTILLLLLYFMLVGCNLPTKIPIQETQNILVAGIDAKGSQIKLTIMVDTMPQGDGSEGKHGTMVYEETADTIYEAKRKLHSHTDKYITWAHLQYIIIGERTARMGVDSFLDFFYRNHENHMSDALAIAYGVEASEFIKRTNTEDVSLTEKLNQVFHEADRLSLPKMTRLLDYASSLKKEGIDPLMPCLKLHEPLKTNEKAVSDDDEEKKMDVILSGYALFQKDKMIATVENEGVGAINWMMNTTETTDLVVTSKSGATVSMEVVCAYTKIDVDYDHNKVNVTIEFESNLAEYRGNDKLINRESLTHLKNEQNKIIQTVIQQTMEYLQDTQCDVIGLGNIYYHHDPVKWQDIKNDWRQHFSELELNIMVESNIQRSYDVLESMDS